MDFAKGMRVMRTVRGLSQTDLALITGIGNTYLSLIESERVMPRPDQIEMIRAGLGWGEREDEALALLAGEREAVPA